MKVSINIPFWYSNEDRLDNLKISYKVSNNLVKWLTLQGIDVTLNVFEFSEDKQYFEKSIYLPIGGGYNKSYKLNTALKHLKSSDKPDIVCFVDSDCFVDLIDYPKVLNTIFNFNPNIYYCNNLTKLDKRGFFNEDSFCVKPSYTYYNTGLIDGLGGMWVCDFNILYEIGGFDERYTIWGREDEDIGKRFTKKGMKFQKLSFKVFHLPHPIEPSRKNKLEQELQEQIYLEDNSIVRPSLLNNYQC
jgi:hypothetical protein